MVCLFLFKDNMVDNENEIEFLDYEDDDIEIIVDGIGDVLVKKDVKGIYVFIYSFGFRDFFLKLELFRVIVDCGFEYFFEGK